MQVNIALLTITDSRTIQNDKSGDILVKKIKECNQTTLFGELKLEAKKNEYAA